MPRRFVGLPLHFLWLLLRRRHGADGGVEIKDAWARATPGGAETAA